jgi:DNA-directed RNA polymerase beta' subunit
MVLEGMKSLVERTQPYNKIWIASIRFHMAPHKLIVKDRFTKDAWDLLLSTILVKNWKAWAVPGELVGIVAAQSIGEPATQMSTVHDTFVVINTPGQKYAGNVGTFIDNLLEIQKEHVVSIGEDSVVLDLKEPMAILGVSNNEKSSWLPISQVSRHPANGGLVEVHTRTGRKTTATLSHSFLKRSAEGIVPVLGSDLKVGMRIPVAKTIPEVPNPIQSITEGTTRFVLDKQFGWVCGMYLADGSLSGNTVCITKIAPVVEVMLQSFCKVYEFEFSTKEKQGEYGPGKDNNIYSKDLKNFLVNTFKEGSYAKEIGSIVYHAPLEFIQGLVAGFFDGDGNVNAERQLIRASSRSRTLLEGINRLLGYCSMFGVLSEETSIRIPDKIQHTLIIPRKFAEHYQQTLGFHLPEKAVALDEIVKYNSRLYVHSQQEMLDKIPELGPIIAETGRLLRMPGQSRTYGRWLNKESIGRATLENYIQNFKEMMEVHIDPLAELQIRTNLAILESAANADVFWDEIVDLVYLDDPKTYVYDFTVPGNNSFMVDDNIFVHNTLNTFHQAGVAAKSAMTRGVPRLKELLKVTKNPKATSLTITLKPEFRNDKDMLRAVSQDLELTLLKDIVKKAAIYYDPEDDNSILEEDRDVIKFFKALEMRKGTGSCGASGAEGKDSGLTEAELVAESAYSKWLIRFEFDREMMFNKNITMDDVYFVIQNSYGFYGDEDDTIHTIYTDYNSQKLIMRIRPKLGNAVYGDDLAAIKKFQNVLLQNTVIRGVPKIRAVTWRKDKNRKESVNGEYKPIDQYMLDTDGSNFVSVMIHPAIDGNKLYSTNVHDVYEQLGIEATRAALYSEINGLFDDADINYRHLGLLCDSMTHAGRLMSVDRYGINKSDNGPLAKACFEETEKVLRDAALFGEMDPVTGVSANIMMGQTIRAGTAFTQILLDESALLGLLEDTSLPPVEEGEEEADGPTQDMIDAELNPLQTDACDKVYTQMNMVLPNADTVLEEEDIELVEI